jgi:glutamate formiminotransferase/formiminotetrahydrofolate cyclodeaminase
LLKEGNEKNLVDLSLVEFAEETASESPAPGGGSISAYAGVLGVSLATMVANLSSHKRGWDDRWEEFSVWAEKGQQYKNELIRLVDEDTNSFNKIMEAFRLPKGSDEEKELRKKAVVEATKYAIEIPFKVMETAYRSMEVNKAMVEFGNPNSVTDAGVGALCARTAVMGAFMNVKINCKDLDDTNYVEDMLKKGAEIQQKAQDLEKEIVAITESKI